MASCRNSVRQFLRGRVRRRPIAQPTVWPIEHSISGMHVTNLSFASRVTRNDRVIERIDDVDFDHPPASASAFQRACAAYLNGDLWRPGAGGWSL